MVPRQDSRKTGGVVKLHYALLFPHCIVWLTLKGLRLRSFGWLRGPGKVETSVLEDTFMIGNWRRCKVSLPRSIRRVSILTLPIDFDGKWKKNGSFSVNTCFELLEGGSQQSVPIKMLWNPTVPTKVGFFAWEVWWGKILTLDQLKKRGFSLVSRCVFCGKDEESLEHLFIHCPKVWCMWTAIFSLSGGGWVCPFLVKDLLRG